MSYQALYRKYRPGTFADLVGQEHVVRTLLHALEQDKVSHAYLFSGVRGTGKTSSAKILAKALNCLQPVGGEPCNQCINCLKINDGTFMDIIEIDAASNRGIDEIRDLREKIKFMPVEGKIKVYIIDEVHMLTTEAFNALLKTLEEPPGHIVFILATTESHKIPLTILSRCQKFDFHKIPMELLKERLKKIALENEGKVTEEALILMTKLAGGGLRDGISLLDQCLTSFEGEIGPSEVGQIAGIVDDEQILGLLLALSKGDTDQTITLYEGLKEGGKSMGQLLQDLIEGYKNILILKTLKNPEVHILSGPEAIAALKKVGTGYEKEDILKWIYRLGELESKMKYSTHPDILLEVALIKGIVENREQPLMEKLVVKQEQKQTMQEKPSVKPFLKSLEVEELWQRFTEALGQKNRSLLAYYKEAEYRELVGDTLILHYAEKYNFHKERAEKPEHQHVAMEVLRGLAGRKISLKIQSFEGEQTKTESPHDKIVEMFGNEVTFVEDKEKE